MSAAAVAVAVAASIPEYFAAVSNRPPGAPAVAITFADGSTQTLPQRATANPEKTWTVWHANILVPTVLIAVGLIVVALLVVLGLGSASTAVAWALIPMGYFVPGSGWWIAVLAVVALLRVVEEAVAWRLRARGTFSPQASS